MEWTNETRIKAASRPAGRLGRTIAEDMNLRHFKLWQWGLGKIPLSDKLTILDIGCGGGGAIRLLHELNNAARICAIDYSQDMVELSRKTNADLFDKGIIEIKNGSVSEIPYPDNIFDLATAFETDYFWPDLTNDFKEVLRVLKPGGIFLIVDEAYIHEKFERRNEKWAASLDGKIRPPEEYNDRLAGAGFINIKVIELTRKNWITVISGKPESGA